MVLRVTNYTQTHHTLLLSWKTRNATIMYYSFVFTCFFTSGPKRTQIQIIETKTTINRICERPIPLCVRGKQSTVYANDLYLCAYGEGNRNNYYFFEKRGKCHGAFLPHQRVNKNKLPKTRQDASPLLRDGNNGTR